MSNSLIYRVVPDITEKEIIDHCKLVDLPNYGEHMSYEEFSVAISDGSIIDYDGSGCLVIGGRMVSNSCTSISDKAIWIQNFAKIPFQKLYEIFGVRISFMWFNK